MLSTAIRSIRALFVHVHSYVTQSLVVIPKCSVCTRVVSHVESRHIIGSPCWYVCVCACAFSWNIQSIGMGSGKMCMCTFPPLAVAISKVHWCATETKGAGEDDGREWGAHCVWMIKAHVSCLLCRHNSLIHKMLRLPFSEFSVIWAAEMFS